MSVDRSRLPAVGPDSPVRFPPVHQGRTASGLEIWTVERHDVPVLTLMMIVPTGSATDPVDRPGLAALTADLLDEGSGDLDALAIHKALARIGGQLDTDTGYDATIVSLSTLSRFHGAAIDLLTNIVFRPRFDADDFARVREFRCNRLTQMSDSPPAQAEQAFVSKLFGTHPYGHLPIGTEHSLRSLTVDDARRFHQARFQSKGMLLIAVGDVSHDAIVAATQQASSDLDATRFVDFAQIEPCPMGSEGRRLVLVDWPNAPQSELRVGHLAVARSTPDYHALVVLNALLGGQFVSRINLNLREAKGFTYGARSGFDWRRAPGPFLVQTSVQTDATAAAVVEILREIEDVSGARPPTERELEVAKASLTRGYPRNFETAEQVARALAQVFVYQLPANWFDEFVDRTRAVEGGAVRAAAGRHLRPADALVTVVGDRARVATELTALGFDSASYSES